MTILATGFFTALALVVAIGAQSAYVLRQAIRRDRLWLIVSICLVSDVILIFAGTAGVGVISEQAPWLLTVLKWAGVAYLIGFAVMSFRSALRPRATGLSVNDDAAPQSVTSSGAGASTGSAPRGDGGTVLTQPTTQQMTVVVGRSTPAQTPLRAVILAALSVSLLNPHAILDTVVLLGTVANNFGDQRWMFALGAVLASSLWLGVLTVGGRALSRVLDTPRTWRIIDASVGCIMLAIVITLILH